MQKLSLVLLSLIIVAFSCSSPEDSGSVAKQEADKIYPNPDPAHNARISLDYYGEYAGVLPCANCAGIEVNLVLARENIYSLKRKYPDKSDEIFTEEGEFQWNKAGNTITLLDADPPNQFFVAEYKLFHLDMEGNRIMGDLEEKYTLHKKK